MLYTIESTLGGFGDVLVEIFALPKACHSGSVLPLLPLWQGFAHHGYGGWRTILVFANQRKSTHCPYVPPFCHPPFVVFLLGGNASVQKQGPKPSLVMSLVEN